MSDYKVPSVKKKAQPKKVKIVRKGIIIEIDKKELDAFKEANWQELRVLK